MKARDKTTTWGNNERIQENICSPGLQFFSFLSQPAQLIIASSLTTAERWRLIVVAEDREEREQGEHCLCHSPFQTYLKLTKIGEGDITECNPHQVQGYFLTCAEIPPNQNH